MSNQVTKKQLLRIIACNHSKWKKVINSLWPWWRRKMSVVEIIQKGLDLDEVRYRHLHYVITTLDIERMKRMDPEWPNTLPPFETVRRYLWGKRNAPKDANVYS